jgi:hypothetical protein
MRHFYVWVVEFIKLLVGRRNHPLLTQCPICQQTVRLHVNRAGRQHVLAHARGLYEGCRLCVHYVAKIKCLDSGAVMIFDPRPNEHERFKLLSWTCKQLSRVAAVGSSFPSKLGPRFGRGLPGEFRLAGQRFANRAIPRARGTPAVTALVRRGSNLKFIGCRLSLPISSLAGEIDGLASR